MAPDPLARAGLAAIFEQQAGCRVVGSAAGLKDLPAALDLYRPDVGLVDLGVDFMPQPGVFDQPAALPLVYLAPAPVSGAPLSMASREERQVPFDSVLVRSVESDEAFPWVGRAILARNAAPELIVHAFYLVLEGLLVQDPKVASSEAGSGRRGALAPQGAEAAYPRQGAEAAESGRLPIDESRLSPLDSPPYDPLTPRELEVLGLIAEGLPNKRVAQRLGISEHTVKYHINAILGKLEAESRTEAVTRAARLGWLIL